LRRSRIQKEKIMEGGEIRLADFSLAKSLLQKGVRRGHVGAIGRASDLILSTKEGRPWIRSRSKIIAFEESWPIVGQLFCGPGGTEDPAPLLTCALHSKQKDAAGLGALAVAWADGDQRAMDVAPDRKAVAIVRAAMERPSAFWGWIKKTCPTGPAHVVASVAQSSVKAAYAPGDIASIYAAAYLATQAPLPVLRPLAPSTEVFPWWVAADKHTALGAEVLALVAQEMGQAYRAMVSMLFHLEGASVNHLEPSPWWAAARQYSFLCCGIGEDRAIEIMKQARWEIIRIMGDRVEQELHSRSKEGQIQMFEE
jgi:hypothetical protein